MGAWLVAAFWNRSERRLRAGWRLALHGAMLVVGTLLSGLAMGLLARGRDLGAGVAIGVASIGAVAAVEAANGWGSYAAIPEARLASVPFGVASAAIVFAGVAFHEELVFRGYHLTNLAEGFDSPRWPRGVAVAAALGLSAVVFGLAHAGNHGASAMAITNVAYGTLFLAVGKLALGDLAMPIGAHFGWNFAQAILGMPVSGNEMGAAMLARSETGPDLITGGAFGPEAGLTGLAAMTLATFLSLAWVKVTRGRITLDPHLGRAPGT